MTANIEYAIQSDNINTQVNAIIKVISDLGTVLNQETEALMNSDRPTILSLQDRKVALGHLYHDAMHTLGDRKDQLKEELTEDKRSLLKQAYKEIHKVFDRNVAALKASQRSVKRLQNIVIDAARQSVNDGPNYNQEGYTGPSEKQSVYFRLNENV